MLAGMRSRCDTAWHTLKNETATRKRCRARVQAWRPTTAKRYKAKEQQGDIRHGRQVAHPCLHRLLMHTHAHSGLHRILQCSKALHV